MYRKKAISGRQSLLQLFISSLSGIHTPLPIIQAISNKMSQVLTTSIPSPTILADVSSPALRLAIKHQNIIGWGLFMKGYNSTYVLRAYSCQTYLHPN
jgi:hypothetical protein